MRVVDKLEEREMIGSLRLWCYLSERRRRLHRHEADSGRKAFFEVEYSGFDSAKNLMNCHERIHSMRINDRKSNKNWNRNMHRGEIFICFF